VLHLLADSAQSSDVASLAADHPFTAIALVLIPTLFGFAPSLLNRLRPKPDVPHSAATAQVDATGVLLQQLVAGLERRLEEADRRADVAEAKHDELQEQLWKAQSKIAALEAEIAQLHLRLIRGGPGG